MWFSRWRSIKKVLEIHTISSKAEVVLEYLYNIVISQPLRYTVYSEACSKRLISVL